MTTTAFPPDDLVLDVRQSESKYNRMLATLNAQNAAVNSQRGAWDEYFSPITRGLLLCREKKYHQRSAELIEALYLHCGVPLDEGERENCYKLSDIGLAMKYDNFPALVVLLEKCSAVFSRSDRPMEILSTINSFTDTLPFLHTLIHRRGMFYPEVLDPNVLYGGTAPLHNAVSCDCDYETNPDPRVVRLLIHIFGADRLLLDENDHTPLYLLQHAASHVTRDNFNTNKQYDDWRARVAAISLMLEPRVGPLGCA